MLGGGGWLICCSHRNCILWELILLRVSLEMLQSGLREKLESLKKKELDWLERMDVAPAAVEASEAAEGDQGEGLDPNDDFKREMHL